VTISAVEVSAANCKIESQPEMFLHTLRRSLFRQPIKYQIITCESVVVGIPEEGKPEPARV
jgi:hypothetical protein